MTSIRGVILDHSPPFHISLDSYTCRYIEIVKELRAAVQKAHSRCTGCTSPSDRDRELVDGIWVPNGRIGLTVTLDGMAVFDWKTVRAVPDSTCLRISSDPRSYIFSGDKKDLAIHFVALFGPPTGTVRAADISHDVRLRSLGDSVFEVNNQPSRAKQARSSSWPPLIADFKLALESPGSVILDNTDAYAGIEDAPLLKAGARFCVAFSSPSEFSSRRFASNVTFYHNEKYRKLYRHLASQLGMTCNSAPEHSTLACLVFDFTQIRSQVAACETILSIAGHVHALVWRQVVEFEETYRAGFEGVLPPFPYCGGDAAIRELLVRIKTYAPKMQVLVAIHGVDTLLDRPLSVSLWANLPHRALNETLDILEHCVFEPVAESYNASGAVQKILITGTYPYTSFSSPSLATTRPTDISGLLSAASLHGVPMASIEHVILAFDSFSKEDATCVLDACRSIGDRILRISGADASDGSADIYYDPDVIVRIILEAQLLVSQRTDPSHLTPVKLGAKVLEDTRYEHLSELIFPLLCGIYLGTSGSFGVLRPLLRQSPSERRIDYEQHLALSYQELAHSRAPGDWKHKALTLLYTLGYIKIDPKNATFTYPGIYEIAGGHAQGTLRQMLNSHLENYSPELYPYANSLSGPPPAPDAPLITRETLTEFIFGRYEDLPESELPRCEEDFQTHVMERARVWLRQTGQLPSDAQTEVWLRCKNGDRRGDVFVLHRTPDGQPDVLYVLELKWRTLAQIKEQTLLALPETKRDRLRCMAAGLSENERLKRFGHDLVHVKLPERSDWIANVAAKNRLQPESITYHILDLSEIRCLDWPHNAGSGPGQPCVVDSVRVKTMKQLEPYVDALAHGVQDEFGFRLGLADARFTKVLSTGETKVVSFVVINLASRLLCIKRLGDRTIKGTLAVAGAFPWTPDRLNADKTRAFPATMPGWRTREWTWPRTTPDIREMKQHTRVWSAWTSAF